MDVIIQTIMIFPKLSFTIILHMILLKGSYESHSVGPIFKVNLMSK